MARIRSAIADGSFPQLDRDLRAAADGARSIDVVES
jgi:hypothetical protein